MTWTAEPGRYSETPMLATQQIHASNYTDVSNLETETTADVDGGFDVGFSTNGSWAEYARVDFGYGVEAVNVRVASGATGGTLEFHLDRVNGPLIATATVSPTGGWQTWTTVTAPVTGAAGVHNLYMVMKGGATSIANLNWFRFQ